MTAGTAGLHQSFADEVERLHAFFDDWFAGRGSRSIEEFSEALDDRFLLVAPTGTVYDRDAIIELVDAGRGAGDAHIRIEKPTVRHAGAVLVGTYEEHQRREGVSSARISTVVMVERASAPGGWAWIAVHETWLADPD